MHATDLHIFRMVVEFCTKLSFIVFFKNAPFLSKLGFVFFSKKNYIKVQGKNFTDPDACFVYGDSSVTLVSKKICKSKIDLEVEELINPKNNRKRAPK